MREGSIPGSNATIIINEEGSGGINQGYMAHGYKINSNLSIGAKISFLFSSIITESTSRIQDSNSFSIFSPAIFDRVSVSDIMLSAGIVYKKPLKNNLNLNLGVTYDHEAKLNAQRFQRLELRDPNDRVIESDTLIDNIEGSITLPRKFGFGISLNKGFNWNVGIDLKLQDWSDFKHFGDSVDAGLSNNIGIIIGGEFTPDINSVSSYFNRITYRVGFNLEKTPYVVNGEDITEYGINFGWSLPIGRISSMDMAFQYGARGTTDNNLVRERYWKIFFGITFNDRWFIRRKFD